MEDALSLEVALDAAIRYRLTKTQTGVCLEEGTSNDHLFDIEQAVHLARISLERGDLLTIVV